MYLDFLLCLQNIHHKRDKIVGKLEFSFAAYSFANGQYFLKKYFSLIYSIRKIAKYIPIQMLFSYFM